MNLLIVFLTIIFTSFGFAAYSPEDCDHDVEKIFKKLPEFISCHPEFIGWHVEAYTQEPKNIHLNGQNCLCTFVRLLDTKNNQERIGYYFSSSNGLSGISYFPETYLPDSVAGEFGAKSLENKCLQVIINGSTSTSNHMVNIWHIRTSDNTVFLQYSESSSKPRLKVTMLSASDLLLIDQDENRTGNLIATIEDIKGKKSLFSLGAIDPLYYFTIKNALYRWNWISSTKRTNRAVKVLQNTTQGILSTKHIFTREDLVTLEYFDPETRTFQATNFGPFRFSDINNTDPADEDFVFAPNNPLSVLAFRDTYFGDSKWKFLSARLERNVFQARLLIAHF